MSGQSGEFRIAEVFQDFDRLLATWHKAECAAELPTASSSCSAAADAAYSKLMQAFGSALGFANRTDSPPKLLLPPAVETGLGVALQDLPGVPFTFSDVLQGTDGALFFTGVFLTEAVGHFAAGERFKSAVISDEGFTLYKGHGRPWWRCSIKPQISLGLGELQECGAGEGLAS